MRIAIVGGHGKIARLLHPLLAAAGHTPVALIRKPEQREAVAALGAEPGMLDLEADDAAAYADAFAGCDAVVFAAGAGADGNAGRKSTVDLGASLKSIEAAERLGIRRFVQVSALAVDDPIAGGAGEVWEAYVVAKRDADIALRASGLDWTIIRPGRLTDDPATDRVLLTDRAPHEDVTRADVAAVLAAVLADDATIGRQWDLIAGERSVPEAIAAALDATEDV